MSRTDFFNSVKKMLKSMKLWVFMTVFIAGAVTAAVITVSALVSFDRNAYTQRIGTVRDYVDKVSKKLLNNVYLINPSSSPDISSELSVAAESFDGRVIILNSSLSVIFDSYGYAVGKTLVSPEAIRCLSGSESVITDSSDRYAEMMIPLYDPSSSPDDRNRGVFFISLSLDDIFSVRSSIVTGLSMSLIICGVFITAICVYASIRVSKPFKQINQSIRHVSEGYVEEQVDIHGFSEMDKISDSFNVMLSRINELEDSRQEFVSNVSHELKTPMTSMKVIAESLVSSPETSVEVFRDFMGDLDKEIDRETTIINDLLALVRLDRKEGDMHIAEVDINKLVQIILKRLKPIADAAGVELLFESFRNVSADVDEVKLTLAITNLITNGIKYNCEDGWVKVSVNADHRYFLIRVADSGIGIPKDSLPRIFDRFYRVDKTRSRQTGGTGLGLAIVKNIVMMHNGSVKVESVEGEGSSFTIRIPLSYIPDNVTEIESEET